MPVISFVIFLLKFAEVRADATGLNKHGARRLSVQEGKVKILQELKDSLSAITAVQVTGEGAISGPDSELGIWRAYLKLETNLAILKLELGVENPGEFVIDESKSRDPLQYLKDASHALGSGVKLLEAGEAASAWTDLRSARNCLRFYLREARKLRLRSARTQKGVKP